MLTEFLKDVTSFIVGALYFRTVPPRVKQVLKMPQCVWCGKEAVLLVNKVPLCLDCDKKLEVGSRPLQKGNKSEEPEKKNEEAAS
jgi:hypothetical protein